MNIEKLYDFVKEYYGYKVSMRYYDSKTNEIACILYDSFWLKCTCNIQQESFNACLITEFGKKDISEIMGVPVTLNTYEEFLKENLYIIDIYCRLRLPDKYLEAYLEAYF